MTYTELCSRLRLGGIENAEWDAALLIEHFCGVAASKLPLTPQKDYPSSPALEDAIRRRLERYPLQYLLGEWEFYRQTYEVSPHCLIPRADTERLVEEAIRLLPENAVIADLCTGSGCIAVSVLAERPDTRAIAVDKFEETLAIACRNAAKNGVADRFTPLLADVLEQDFRVSQPPLDAILSNPPYIPTVTVKTLEPELFAEPLAALDGGEDGLLFYRALLRGQTPCLKPDGFFLFEIGFDQADALCRLGDATGWTEHRVIRDYGGNDRVLHLRRPLS